MDEPGSAVNTPGSGQPKQEVNVARIPSYDKYINGSAWEHRRLKYFAIHRKACARCKSTKQIHLHHLSYDQMGHEPDSDLTPLCQNCHTIVHRFHELSGLSLRESTEKVLAIGRESRPPKSKARAFVKTRGSSNIDHALYDIDKRREQDRAKQRSEAEKRGRRQADRNPRAKKGSRQLTEQEWREFKAAYSQVPKIVASTRRGRPEHHRVTPT